MPRGTIRYQMNIPGLRKIMTGKGMEAMLRGEAQRGKQYAELIAPVDTGDYASSFRVASSRHGAGARRSRWGSDWSDRAAAYLYNDSDHAILVEFEDDFRTLGVVADIIENGA